MTNFPHKLTFSRKLSDARAFEKRAIDGIASDAGIPGYYPYSEAHTAKLEAQWLRPAYAPGKLTDTIDVFFLLKTGNGSMEIEIALQNEPDVWCYGGFIWAGSSGKANLTIENEVVNGYQVLSSMIDGSKVRFVFDGNSYTTEDVSLKNLMVKPSRGKNASPTRKAA